MFLTFSLGVVQSFLCWVKNLEKNQSPAAAAPHKADPGGGAIVYSGEDLKSLSRAGGRACSLMVRICLVGAVGLSGLMLTTNGNNLSSKQRCYGTRSVKYMFRFVPHG